MSTMLLESALAELSSIADDGNRPGLGDHSRRHGLSYTDRRPTAETHQHKPVFASHFSSISTEMGDSFPPIPPNADTMTPSSSHPNSSDHHLATETDRKPPDRSPPVSVSPRHSAEMDRQKSTLLDGSPPISASRRPFEEKPPTEMASNPRVPSRDDQLTRRLSTYEKQISIDPHSVSYRALGSTPFVWESEVPGRRNPGEASTLSNSHNIPLQPPPVLARLSTSDASTAPHSPRSINFPGKMRSYLRGRLSVPDLTQVSPSAETLNSDYSSDRSSDYSTVESPISTLDLHRSPLTIAPPSPPPEYYYNTIYVPPPPPPPPRYSTLTAGTGGTARSLFSAPLPQPQRMGSYKKTISFQVREVDDFTYGRQERYKVTGSDIVERPASLRHDIANSQQLDAYVQSSRGASMERHASSQLDAYMQASRGASMERPASLRLDAYNKLQSTSRGVSMERRNHSLREIIENPRSSSAEMSCCSFIPFLGGPKARLSKEASQLKISSPVTSQRVYDIVYDNATPRSNGGHLKQSVISEQITSLNHESPEAIFREPSVMERFEYRNSASTGELFIEGEEEDELDDEDEELNKIERAEEVLLSFNEAYSPVASAFVFHPSEGTRNNGGEVANIVPRKALKGSNPAAATTAGTRPAFRRVRFNLESAEVEQEAESELSSIASNSREMSTMMATMQGPSSLSRSTTRRAWDELLNKASNEGRQEDEGDGYGNPQYYTRAESIREHQADLLLRLVNGAKSSKESTSYKPMLFRPDTN